MRLVLFFQLGKHGEKECNFFLKASLNFKDN